MLRLLPSPASLALSLLHRYRSTDDERKQAKPSGLYSISYWKWIGSVVFGRVKKYNIEQ